MCDNRLELDAIGYIHYKNRITMDRYPEITLNGIIEHRDSILQKYAGTNHKTVNRIIGMGFTDGLFIPTDYDGTVVDADDVFAAIYHTGYADQNEKDKKEKYVLWILFTNDRYLPMLPMVCIQEYNLYERLTQKEKNDFKPVIESHCHNLKYPICTIEQFEEILNREYTTRGNVKKSFMLEQIYDAWNQIGFFQPDTITCEFGERTVELLGKYGYRLD